ncbi:hypothetical protein GCM10023094_26480 [Rhodococcus olei]|uniref:DUF222 domain-containing protein n=1 Tax=Rhodococcus olei TaxID=2161675 RepID=A0ABP8P1W6_9NOCA
MAEDRVKHHLAALHDAVEGPLDAPLTGLPDDDVIDVLRRLETTLRRTAAVGHRLVVEVMERSIPGNLDCRSITDFLTQTLRISGADAARRVRGATKVGTWHTPTGVDLDPALPESARAVRDGDIGPDHVAAIATILRKIPHNTPIERIEVAEAILATAARDTRTAVQRNHDALEAGLRHLHSSGVLGSHRGLPVTVIATMTVQQLEDATGLATTGTGGLVPVRDALRMAEKAHPVLAVFDHHGRPLHLGRSKRLASADQRLALIAASRGCTRPGCDAPASMTAVRPKHFVQGGPPYVTEWNKGGRTDIDSLDLACDHCHALVHDGPGGWRTRTAADGTAHPGRTEWIPPAHLDPTRTPRVNHRHHLDRTVAQALDNHRARRDAEAREHRRRWNRGVDETGDGDAP